MKVRVIRTSLYENERWSEIKPDIRKGPFKGGNCLSINENETFQTHMGFGGAFTEAAAYTLSEISASKREEVLRAYFDKKFGLGYSIGRMHMNSCDFSLENYDYVSDDDKALSSFNIEREERWVIPLVKDALGVSGEKIDIMISPWSPPAFMKSNGEMNYGGYLLSEYRDSWVLYYVKFIEELEKRGVPVWGLSVQNEPAAVQVWDSCIYSAEEERNFIRDHLGPMLHDNGMEDKKLVIWDHNRDILVERAATVLDDEEARKYVWGTGNHWYVSEEFENLSVLHNLHPDKEIIFTEGTQEEGPHPGEWFPGERYGRNIIGDFNNWSVGFMDWNLVLNELGGPNHVGNYCDAPILVYRDEDRLLYNSSYYYIGHFSRHIRPGAVRIACSGSETEKVYFTAFRNPDDSKAIVMMNENEEGTDYEVLYEGERILVQLSPRSIVTVVID